jgi:hypothetical protein
MLLHTLQMFAASGNVRDALAAGSPSVNAAFHPASTPISLLHSNSFSIVLKYLNSGTTTGSRACSLRGTENAL